MPNKDTLVSRDPVTLPGLVAQYGVNYYLGNLYYLSSEDQYFRDRVLFENKVIASRRSAAPGKIVSKSLKAKLTSKEETVKEYSNNHITSYFKDSVSGCVFSTTAPKSSRPARIKNNGRLSKFPYNSKKYSCAMPFFDALNERLYFCSDMPGGFGGWDIYYSDWDGTKWLPPVNIGKQVNTSGNEIFPSFISDGIVFSSDGHAGKGGLDHYYYSFSTKDIVDLYVFNTEDDDYSLRFTDKAFYTAIGISNNHCYYYRLSAPFDSVYVPSSGVSSQDDKLKTEILNSKDTDVKSGELVMAGEKTEAPVSDTVQSSKECDGSIKSEVYFAAGSYSLDNVATNKLDSISEFLSESDSPSIFINGFADNVGTIRYNDFLSYQRALSVRNYLDKHLTPGKQKICVLILGENYSGSGKDNEKADDRKVEIVISQDKIEYQLLYAYKTSLDESLSDIARLFNNDIETLGHINRLEGAEIPGNGIIYVGIQGIHQVKKGENLYRVGVNYHTDFKRLEQINKKTDFKILKGELLVVPLQDLKED